jgi:hypothetical protein
MRVTVEYQGKELTLPPTTIEVPRSATVEELLTLYSANHNQLDLTKVAAYLDSKRINSQANLVAVGVPDDGKIIVRDAASGCCCCCALF